MSIEDGNGERRDGATIQVMPEDIRKDYPWAFEKAQSCQHLDLKLLTPWRVSKYIAVVLSHQVAVVYSSSPGKLIQISKIQAVTFKCLYEKFGNNRKEANTEEVITTSRRFRNNPGTPETGSSPVTLPASLWPEAVFEVVKLFRTVGACSIHIPFPVREKRKFFPSQLSKASCLHPSSQLQD